MLHATVLPLSAFSLSPRPPQPTPWAPPGASRRLRAGALETSPSRRLPRGEPRDSARPGSFEVLGGARRVLLPGPEGPGLPLKPYEPFPVLGWNRHLETIFAAFFRSVPDVRLRRECLRTVDDGVVALDWVSGDERSLPSEAPVLILLPGLTGGSEDSYVRHMLVRARSKGWRAVVFNSRGCADSPVTTPKGHWRKCAPAQNGENTLSILYSASFTGDLSEVVNHVSTRYPKSKVYAIGWSIGANILVQYLGQESHSCPFSGAVSLCNPFNLVIADEEFRKGFNNVYDKALARALCRIFKKHALLFQDMGAEYNIQLTANAKSLRVFDEGLTHVSFGFKSVDDYYFKSSSSFSIKNVRTPLLCIQAANDPLAPSRQIPRDEIQDNPYCLLIVTPQGGHLGWIAGDEAPFGAPWTDTVVMDFLEHLQAGRAQIPAGNPVNGVKHPEKDKVYIAKGDLEDGLRQSQKPVPIHR